MQLGPIVSSLRRHKTASALIVIEIALTCAIVANAIFLINQRLSSMEAVSGVAESEVVIINVAGIEQGANSDQLTVRDLAALAALPGVQSAATTNQTAFGGTSWNSNVHLEKDDSDPGPNAAVYLGSEDLVETFGLQIISGRDFNREEYVDHSEAQNPDSKAKLVSAILTKDFAIKLFGTADAVGKSIYSWGDDPIRVVGIVEKLRRPGNRDVGMDWSLIFPIRLSFDEGRYILRTNPGSRDQVLKAAVDVINANNPNRIVLAQRTFEEERDSYFQDDRAMAWLLVIVCIALLLITALGIIGLASFWVQQRTQQIGIRRALGANRTQILRYFQTENLLLTTVGLALGVVLAYGVNALLMKHYEIARLPVAYLPVCALVLYGLCQLAVLGPARRAARVPPAVATRGA